MGLSLSLLPFLDSCHRAEALREPFFCLGGIELSDDSASIISFAEQAGFKKLASNPTARVLLSERYNIHEIVECDYQSEADLEKYFTSDIDPLERGKFGTLLNAGGAEHLLDQGRVNRNIHDLIRPEGSIIHLAPVTWYDHGFYNYNPKFFRGLQRSNQYEMFCEGFQSAMPLFGELPEETSFYFTFDSCRVTPYHSKLERLIDSRLLPARLLYCSAFRKKATDAPFRMPRELSNAALEFDREQDIFSIGSSNFKLGEMPSTGSELFDSIDFVDLDISGQQLGPDEGHAYVYKFKSQAGVVFARLSAQNFEVSEDGKPLTWGNFTHDQIRDLGEGRCSLWGDKLYLSSTDNSDPRQNGKRYTVRVPGFVNFVEKLPASGIKKFGV